MSDSVNDILDDVAATLRNGQDFAAVTRGNSDDPQAVPRVAVLLEKTRHDPAEGFPNARWTTVQIKLIVTVRTERAGVATSRLGQLIARIDELLLAEPSRGGVCHDLPIGPATELIGREIPPEPRYPGRKTSLAPARPIREHTLVLRCRFETPPASIPTATIDAASPFASGPMEIAADAWPREQRRRAVPGLDGEFVVDLGRRSRTLHQTGRLFGPSASNVRQQVNAIEALTDGALHELTYQGCDYPRVLVESIALTTPIRLHRQYTADYTLTYRQLP